MARTGNGADISPPSPERVAELVQSLAAVMRQADVTELDLEVGSVSVRLRRPTRDNAVAAPERAETGDSTLLEIPTSGHVITAPMIGTFYASPTPGAQPFVGEGDDIFIGQTIGIIEAMKIMNEIAADRSGTVAGVLVGDGQPVEYGSPLLRLALARGERA